MGKSDTYTREEIISFLRKVAGVLEGTPGCLSDVLVNTFGSIAGLVEDNADVSLSEVPVVFRPPDDGFGWPLLHRTAKPAGTCEDEERGEEKMKIFNREKPRIVFSLCHTTARLPDGWRAAAQAWYDNCDHPENVEHIITSDEVMYVDPIFPNTKVGINDGPKTAVAGWNLAYRMSEGKFIISLADDWFPCEHWDTKLLNALPKIWNHFEQFPDLDGEHVLDVDTGGNYHLLTFTLATRKYVEKYNKGEGWLFYPEYTGMYADNDWSDSARLDKVIVNAKHLKFPHIHPAYTPGMEADAIHKWQGRPEAYKTGIKVYKQRCKEKGLLIRPRLAVCLPGETFSHIWMACWTTLVNELGKHFDMHPVFAWSSNVHVTRACMYKEVINVIPGFDYILWLDDDNLLSFPQFTMLLNDLMIMPEADMVVGWCWVQPDVYEGREAVTSAGRMDERGTTMPYAELMEGEKDVKEIGWSGFPVVLMRGGIEEKAGENPFVPIVDPTHEYGFASEDKSFCLHARAGGCRIFVDRRVKVPHLKIRDAEPKVIPEIVEKTPVMRSARESLESIGFGEGVNHDAYEKAYDQQPIPVSAR